MLQKQDQYHIPAVKHLLQYPNFPSEGVDHKTYLVGTLISKGSLET